MNNFIESLTYAKLIGDPNAVELFIEKEIIDILSCLNRNNYISEYFVYDNNTNTIYIDDSYIENTKLYKNYSYNSFKIITIYAKQMLHKNLKVV